MLGIVMRTEKQNTSATVRGADHSVRRRERREIPTQLRAHTKQGAESVFDDVPVHYNSGRPSRLDALAYTQEKQVDVRQAHQANIHSAGKRVAIIQRMRNNVVQRCESGQGGSGTIKSQIQELKSKTPQQLLDNGWRDITDPRMAANTTSLDLQNPETGLKIRFDKGVEGACGFEAIDHYHIYNDNYTKKKVDFYFDIDGHTVGKGSKASHIVIGGGD